jgi:hypothetical protein
MILSFSFPYLHGEKNLITGLRLAQDGEAIRETLRD